MTGWTWTTHEHVRFGDCDAMGHANNAVYSTYLEQARIGALGGLDPFILARVEIDFRSELRAGDELEIRTGDRLAAEARSVLVGYDYRTATSTPLSDETKRRLTV